MLRSTYNARGVGGELVSLYVRETIKPNNRPTAKLPVGSEHMHGHPRPCRHGRSKQQARQSPSIKPEKDRAVEDGGPFPNNRPQEATRRDTHLPEGDYLAPAMHLCLSTKRGCTPEVSHAMRGDTPDVTLEGR